MKKIFARPLCIVLMLAMLVPMMSVMASAAEITNLYDNTKVEVGTPPTSGRDDAANANDNYYTSTLVEVKAGDVVTFGPVFINQGYYLTTYDENGATKINKVAYKDCTKVAEIMPGVEIVSWTVTEGTASLKMATSQMFYDSTVITVNQEWGKDDYFAAMDKAGVNVDYLRPTDTSEALVNIFPKADNVFAGRADKSNKEIADERYITSPAIPVKAGDVLYFAGADLGQGYQLVLLDADGKGTTTVNKNFMVQYEDFGNGLGIYAYRLRPGTAYVRVVAATSVYNEGKQLVTINQPLTSEGYNNYFNPPATEPAPVDPVPTGDSALVFAAIAIISLVGVAVVAKRREN